MAWDGSNPAEGTLSEAGDQTPSSRAVAFGEAIALLRTRRYGTFVFASLLSNLGTWAQQVAEPWLLLSLGASPLLLGLDSFAQGAPAWALTLVGGLLADRADRRRVIAVCQSLQALCPATLVILILTHAVAPWMIITASLLVGITDALSMPAFQSIAPSIVERDQIPAALALNATQFNLSRITGPVLAGLLISTFGLAACFAANTVSYLPFIGVAVWILPRGVRGAARAADPQREPGLWSGLGEILREPYLRGGLLTVLTTGFFCSQLLTFCPVLVRDALHGGVAAFGIAIGAFGLGGLAGAVGLMGLAPERDRRPIASGFAILLGAATAAAALDPWAGALPVLLFAAGLALSVSNTSANTLLQSAAPARLRGRAVSLYMLSMRGGVALGGLATGAAIHLVGVRHALLIDGAAAALTHIALGWAWRRASPSAAAAPG